jgi:predicted PurR-regulated permease PerM
LTTLVFTLALATAYVARAVIIIFAFAILFAYLINPVVRFLQRHSLFFKNLRGPHVLEAYLVFVIGIVALGHALTPRLHAVRFVSAIPTITDRFATGQIANDLGENFGWTNTQATQIRTFLQQHRSTLDSSLQEIGRFAAIVIPAVLVIPILAIFFLSDGRNLANQAIRLPSPKRNHAALEFLASQLNDTLQHYIRAKVTLAGLSFLYCSVTMLVLGFPSALPLALLAGILEFIPVAGWTVAAASIVSVGALAHSHWLWMLALLCIWRIVMDYWIAPRVMGHELEIHPLLAIFTLMVGGAIGGVVGIYLSIPIVAMGRVVYRYFSSDVPLPESPDSSTELLTVTSNL